MFKLKPRKEPGLGIEEKRSVPDIAEIPKKHLEYWQKERGIMISRAIVACTHKANSYRGFHVGCSMLGYNKESDEYNMGVDAGNYKPFQKRSANETEEERARLDALELEDHNQLVKSGWDYLSPYGKKGDETKRCAERNSLDLVKKNRDSDVIGMVICSTNDWVELDKAVSSDVIFPCEECREMLAQSPLVRPWTRITLIKANKRVNDMEPAKVYDEVEANTNLVREGGIIEVMKEMSYADFAKRVQQGKI